MPKTLLAAAFLLLVGVLAACGSEGTARPTPASTPEAELIPLAAGQPLLLDWASATLRPVDPVTAQDLPDYEPFDMGHWATTLVSPDGQMLSAVIGPKQEASSGSLHFFDLEAWRETFRLDEPTGSIHPFAWSPDNAQLFAVAEKQLWVVDVREQNARLLADFDFWTDGLDVSPDGKTLYLFAFDQSDADAFMVRGDPFLVAVDADTGEIRGRATLPGVLVGQRHEEESDGEFYAIYSPALAMSPDGTRYYVVHPDTDRVTIVNLENMTVDPSLEVARRKPLLGRLASDVLGLVVSSAEAKGGLNASKQALVSPDGRWLYITGVEEGGPDTRPDGRKPLGLKVVDTGTMDVVYEEEGIDSIALSPDGRWLFGTGWAYGFTQVSADEYMTDDYQGWGLKVIDARSPQLVDHINPDGIYQQMVVGDEGRYVYLLSEGPGIQEAVSNQGICSKPCQLVNVLDVDSRRVVGERPMFSFSSAELINSHGGR